MQVEDYFDFLSERDIRLKGSRIGIESILYEYVHAGRTPEEIADQLPSLSLEQIYAAILYFLHNREELSAYLAEWLAHGRAATGEQDRQPPPVVERLRRINAERQDREAAA